MQKETLRISDLEIQGQNQFCASFFTCIYLRLSPMLERLKRRLKRKISTKDVKVKKKSNRKFQNTIKCTSFRLYILRKVI